jgi:sugar/nucleoside kinase (ribokinase family)
MWSSDGTVTLRVAGACRSRGHEIATVRAGAWRNGVSISTRKLILLQLEVPPETVYLTVTLATRHGRRVILNPAPATLALDLAKLQDVAFLTPNRGELALLSGMPTGSLAEIEA